MNALHSLINFYNENTSQNVYFNVAKSLLENIHLLRNGTIYDWAESCNASTATISRFTHKMGYKNFVEFRYELNTSIDNFALLDQLAPINQLSNFDSPIKAYSSLLLEHISSFISSYDEAAIISLVDYIHDFSSIRLYTHGVDVNQLILQSSLFLDHKTIQTIRFESDQLKDVSSLTPDTLVILTKPNVIEKTLTLDILRKLKEKNIPILMITNSKQSTYLTFADKSYSFNGFLTQLDDPIFFLIITLITLKYRERYLT